ncbi:MAG: hypothetical protein ACK5RO_05960 [Pseudobdellovibrionaceae bacterium]
MSAVVVWMDSEHAKLFHVTTAGVKKTELKKHGAKHSNSHQDGHHHKQEEQFFHEVAQAAGAPEEFLVFGPGMAKTHFKTHLEKHNHKKLMGHLVGVETLEAMTDNQILDAARKYFKKYNQFNSSI